MDSALIVERNGRLSGIDVMLALPPAGFSIAFMGVPLDWRAVGNHFP